MDGMFIFSLIVLLLYYVVTRLFPKLFGWIIRKRYNIDARIGRIGLPYPNLQNIVISKNGFTIYIDKINFRSSFISSEVTKLICLVVHDVRINKDVVYHNFDDEAENQDYVNDISFHDQKIPPSIIILAQFLAVHIRTITAALFRPESPEWLIHATANDVHLDVSMVRSARTLLANITTTSASAKLFRDTPPPSALPYNKPRPATCLAELSVALTAEATVMAQGPFSVEKLFVGLEHTKAIFNEGFYSFAQERKQQQKEAQGSSLKNKYKKRRSKTYSNGIQEKSGLEKLAQFSPIIPKTFTLCLQNGVLTGMKGSTETELSASLRLLHIETKFSIISPPKNEIPTSLPVLSLSVAVDGLHCRGRYDKILELRKLSLETKLENKELSLAFSLNTLLIVYNHKDIHTWLTTDFLRSTSLKMKNNEVPDADTILKKNSWLKDVSIDCSAEMWNVTSFLKFSRSSNSNPVIGFSKSKFTLSCDPVPAESSPVIVSENLFDALPLSLSKRCWNSELLVETLWFSLKYSIDFSSGHLKKYHLWGTPLFLGVALIKVKGRLPPNTPKVNAMLDTVRFEWSPPLAVIIILMMKCINDYQLTNSIKSKPPKEAIEEKKTPVCSFVAGVTLTNFNGFFIADKKVCIMSRVDSMTFESGMTKQNFVLSGARLVSMCPSQAQFICHRYDDVKSASGNIKLARFEWKGSNNLFTVEILEEIEAYWSPNLHLKLLTLVEEFLDFRSNIAPLKTLVTEVDLIEEPVNKKEWGIQVRLKAKMTVGLILSKEHQLHFTTGNVTYRKSGDQVNIETTQFDISVDGCNIFTVENLQVTKIHDSEVVKVERTNCDGFILPWNSTWGIAVRSLKAIFPYEHNFAEAVQNEFFSIVKWLKLIHKKPGQKNVSPLLPSDMIIKVKEFIFEMSDDPFEVHLRDNFELLEDEYKESLKRQKMLEAKLAEYCKAHLLIPSNKVEELYNNLNKLNAQIYIQRSKQMKAQLPMRTRLFAWLMTDLEIIVLADPSIHGPENVVKIMTEIDVDTPWPEEGVEFTTLWCRSVAVSCHEWKFQLRDFPQPWLDIKSLHLWGCLVGAEQEATRRAKRGVVIELGDPYGEVIIERGMAPLKFYHDFNCEVEHYSYAFGPCWEPVIAQCNQSLEKIFSPSRDPSPPLPWWDKMRLLYHGRLTMVIRQLTVLLHASLDPYNTMEEMEVTWTNVAMDWTNARFVFKGDFDVFVRTASKYDDCRLLHLPNLKLSIKLTWLCLGDPNDHHSVMPCAPDKLPEYSSNQEHDSFRSFRSQNLNVSLSFETKPNPNSQNELDCPIALLYGSTFRWFENLKLILSGVTRPTRRGTIFSKTIRPRKLPLSRHYKKIHLSFGLHCFQIHYWMSFSMQRGLEIQGQRMTYSSEYTLNLVPVEDGLKHRPRPVWSIMYMNCELNDAEVWLKSALKEENGKELVSFRQPVEKCYCLSVGKVCYGRETTVPNIHNGTHNDTPTHRLVVYHLRGAWTTSNRDVAFALFDSFMKTKQIKKNLSTEALKVFRKTDTNTPHKSRGRGTEGQLTPPLTAISNPIQANSGVQAAPSPMTKLQSGHAANMLQQLIAEADKKSVVFSNDLSAQTKEQNLQGLAACQEDDVVHKNWSIALVNSQVLLKGCETKGYVILSAAKAEILQRIHRPVWKDRTLVSKVTWVGSLECMQYYATVSAGENDSLDENIMWLSVENIQEESPTVIVDLPDIPDLVGSGKSVGGVVSETVGATSDLSENAPLQLQRIVSRCKCEFFYAGYGESSIDPSTLSEVPAYPPEESSIPWEKNDRGVDSFTLMHHDLDVCTNSLQYAMILDIVNNLLLYVEPRRKEAYERLQRMRFQLQLHSVEDQRRPIQQLQNDVRCLVAKLRRLEKETYLIQRAMLEEPGHEDLMNEMEELESQVHECKDQLIISSEELDMMLSCHKEKQLTANQRLATLQGDKPVTTARINEICFKHAQWRLTQTDGQLGIADLVLSNFLYTKSSKSDDSVEHLLELGYVRMTNLLPNQIYKEVIVPTEIQSNMPVDRKRAIRVFCREKAPVGGISVKEHFEINVVPLTIGLTKKFFNTMLKFCFPEKDPENIENEGPETDVESSGNNKKLKGSTNSNKKGKDSNFYVPMEQKDDVEKMKERAEKNKLFIYIKIPEVPVRVSFKGNKEKNIEDIRDFSLVIPTLEYHNVTWTWLDLLLAMKNDSRRVILSQAIKQKLNLKKNVNAIDDGNSPQEEDKARMLFGNRLMPEACTSKKGFFKFPK